MKHKLSLSDIISLDSLKLRIPLIQVSLKDKGLLDHLIEVNSSTGEVNPEYYKRKAKEYTISDSVKIRIGIQNVVTSKGLHTEQLIVLLNTKILGSRYFEGFTKDNIDLAVYAAIDDSIIFYEKEKVNIPRESYQARAYYKKLLEELIWLKYN